MQGNNMPNDYFADSLIASLDHTPPIEAAFIAQDESRKVGFDFVSLDDVVDRALDEVREAEEAYMETGINGREHFGDEIADIMFSLINIVRHSSISSNKLTSLTLGLNFTGSGALDFSDFTKYIRYEIAGASKYSSSAAAHKKDIGMLFIDGMQSCINVSVTNSYDPLELLRENVRKYLLRCQAIEELAADEHKTWADIAKNNEIITYWKKAKKNLK